MADVVEVMAVAHFERDGNRWDRPEMTDADRAAFMADMQAALSALDAAGYVVVSKALVAGVVDSLRAASFEYEDRSAYPGAVKIMTAQVAMLSASQVKP